MINKAITQEEEQPATTGRGRGWASLSPERRREIASKAGKAAWQYGTPHRFTPGPDGTAVSAGRKGGSISRRKPRQEQGT